MSTSPFAGALAKVRSHGLKYSAVSVVNVIVGQGLLILFHTVAGIPATLSNVMAVCISAVPAYYLNRAWVWGKRGKSHFTKEILPFWGFAFAGLIMSTLAVDWATEHFDSKLIPNIANLAAFGTLWVLKFFVLDSLLFGAHHHHPDYEHDDTVDAEVDDVVASDPVGYPPAADEAAAG